MRRVPQTLGSRTILFCCKGVRARVFVFHAATPSRGKNHPRDTLKLRTRANRPKKRQLDSRLNFSVRFFAFSIEYFKGRDMFSVVSRVQGWRNEPLATRKIASHTQSNNCAGWRGFRPWCFTLLISYAAFVSWKYGDLASDSGYLFVEKNCSCRR